MTSIFNTEWRVSKALSSSVTSCNTISILCNDLTNDPQTSIVRHHHTNNDPQTPPMYRSQDVNITARDRIVVASYFLPVVLSKSSSGQWSIAWDNENILSLKADSGNANITSDKISWVGTVRFKGAPIPPEEEGAVTHLLQQMNCFPVFVNPTMHHQFYEVFCKQHLWMILHHVADVYGPLMDIGAKAQQDLWFTYSTVNRQFRDKVVEVFQVGDLIWIHGFHLMLLPSFLRRVLIVAKIGIFFHTPFPSSEIWRTMHRREDLLRGVLAADQVGFHLYVLYISDSTSRGHIFAQLLVY